MKKISLSCFLLIGLLVMAQAQFPDELPPQDSIPSDSLAPWIASEIIPDTRRIDPEAIFEHQEAESPLNFQLKDIYLWDRREYLQGFAQTLGQIGKPVLLWKDGFQIQADEAGIWRDPVMGSMRIYSKTAAQQNIYYDTKTPYLNLDYKQGGRKYQAIDGTFSRNINPNWNLTGNYGNQKVDGAYENHFSKDRYLSLGLYYRSPSRRYHLFANGTYSESLNHINGGLFIDTALVSTTPEALLQFGKQLETPQLKEAIHFGIIQGLHIDQHYRLLGPDIVVKRDSNTTDTLDSGPHRLNLRLTADLQRWRQRFGDGEIDSARLSSSFSSPYPTLRLDHKTLAVHEAWITDEQKIDISASYAYLKPNTVLRLKGGLHYSRLRYQGRGGVLKDTRISPWIQADIERPWNGLSASFKSKNSTSTLFDPTSAAQFSLIFRPDIRPQTLLLTDTFVVNNGNLSDSSLASNDFQKTTADIHQSAPLSLGFKAGFSGKNPTIFQKYYQADTSNSYQSNINLLNQKLLKFELSLAWEGDRKIRDKDTLLSNFLGLRAWLSRADRFIYYNTQMEIRQATANENLTWIGLELKGRWRMFGKFTLTSQLNFQKGNTTNSGELAAYTSQIPALHSKTAIFYENHNISYAGMVRWGVELHFFTDYQAFRFDAISGEYFPSTWKAPYYPRLDLYYATQIKSALVWIRFTHVNELLLKNGYVSTPFYPELERTFALGIRWVFYD